MFIHNNNKFKKLNLEKVNVHANGDLSTLRCLNNFKTFNYTKIDKSTVLRSGPITSQNDICFYRF